MIKAMIAVEDAIMRRTADSFTFVWRNLAQTCFKRPVRWPFMKWTMASKNVCIFIIKNMPPVGGLSWLQLSTKYF
jgi:hypothetical protein